MSTLLVGSISLSKLNEKAKEGHSAFSRGADGKIYVNVKVWINDEVDNYGNIASIQLNKAKDSQEPELYFGNLKDVKSLTGTANADDLLEDDDLPL